MIYYRRPLPLGAPKECKILKVVSCDASHHTNHDFWVYLAVPSRSRVEKITLHYGGGCSWRESLPYLPPKTLVWVPEQRTWVSFEEVVGKEDIETEDMSQFESFPTGEEENSSSYQEWVNKTYNLGEE